VGSRKPPGSPEALSDHTLKGRGSSELSPRSTLRLGCCVACGNTRAALLVSRRVPEDANSSWLIAPVAQKAAHAVSYSSGCGPYSASAWRTWRLELVPRSLNGRRCPSGQWAALAHRLAFHT